ncbi:MAG: hypothetical protein GX819_02030, partial [Clostridiaceae bacterium]|nr:hypothetical protein [Clostridiaceae bacterium]
TDSRYYEELADNVYRFQPLRLKEEELALMHGTDEHLVIDKLADMLAFYRELLVTLN